MQPCSDKKKGPGSSVLLSPPIVQSGLFMSIIMCLIPFTTGEDDVSFLRNVKALQTEYKKMRHYPKRREDITMNP